MGKPSKQDKKPGRLRWLLLFFLMAAGLLLFVPIDISHVPYLKPTLDAWKRLGITAEKISITPRGRILARNVKFGSPVACLIGDLSLDVSLPELLQGRVVIRKAHGNAIQVHWKRLDGFFHTLQKRVPARLLAVRLSNFGFAGTGIEMDGVFPGRMFRLQEAGFELKWKPFPWADVSARGIRIDGFPDIPAASFRFQGGPRYFVLNDLVTQWNGIRLRGRVTRDSAANLEGTLDFDDLDLESLARNRLDTGEVLTGALAGNATFKAALSGVSGFEASGSFRGGPIRLRDFPFQKDPLIRDHMPELHDVRFDSLRVAHWRVQNGRTELDSLSADGSPLSLRGRGRVVLAGGAPARDSSRLRGDVFFNLVGHLREDYYRSLRPLVQAGLYRDSSGLPTFKFQVVGNFQRQEIRLEKSVSRVVKSLGRVIGEKFRNLVGP